MNVRRPILQVAAAGYRAKPLAARPTFSIPIPLVQKNSRTSHPTPKTPDFTRISYLFSNTGLKPGSELEDALTATQIKPNQSVLLEVFNHFDSSPKLLFTLFIWAQKQPNYHISLPVFNAMINSLAKAREFDSAWSLIHDQINGDATERPDLDTFAIMIRRYTRAGLPSEAIRTFEYASTSILSHPSTSAKNLFEILVDSLCKEGHVKIASECFDKQNVRDPSWLPTIKMYNILLNGWFRARKLKRVERLWVQMKNEDMKPTVVTYGTLIEGYCRVRRPDIAIKLLDEMKMERVEPNAIVYNPIIDALGEAGRFKEALGMLERLSILETGPTMSTYNSLVKGYCKAGDVEGACKVLKMMIDDKCLPTSTTYSYFFKRFAIVGESELALDLYNKMVRSGYEPDQLTYHLLVKMLSKEGKLGPVTQIIKEMKTRGFDLDLATSTMLIHLLCKMNKYDEACFEFEDMFRRGIVPQQLTYLRMVDELEKRGMGKMAQKLHDLMASVPHSTKVPDTFKGFRDDPFKRKTSIIYRAEAMADMLKTCKNPRELVKRRN